MSLLKGGQIHSTTNLCRNSENTFRKLGIDVTYDTEYSLKNPYYSN